MLIEKVIRWLDQEAYPLVLSADDCDVADWRAFQSVFEGVQVLGMGEATHGTREIFQLRLRLLKFLVQELGFDTLAIEGSESATRVLNDYIMSDYGDHNAVVSGLGALMWDVEEFLHTVDWLREHNNSAHCNKKVRIVGLDSYQNDLGRNEILSAVQQVAPEKLISVSLMLERVRELEEDWFKAMEDDERDSQYKELILELEAFIDYWVANEQNFRDSAIGNSIDKTLRSIEVMRDFVASTITDFIPSEIPKRPELKNLNRSLMMARNVERIVQLGGSATKVIVWAHNYHLGVKLQGVVENALPNMGWELRRKFGTAYFVIGTEVGSGTFLCRELTTRRALGELCVKKTRLKTRTSLSWWLGLCSFDFFFLTLREKHCPRFVASFMTKPMLAHFVGWVYTGCLLYEAEVTATARYDAIIFLRTTTATTPTRTAITDAACGKRH